MLTISFRRAGPGHKIRIIFTYPNSHLIGKEEEYKNTCITFQATANAIKSVSQVDIKINFPIEVDNK